jgi:hypothetical protein
MCGPVTFRSPYRGKDVRIETLGHYRAWVRTVERIDKEFGAEGRAFEIWEEERNGRLGNENECIDGC